MTLKDRLRFAMQLDGATVIEIGALYRPFVERSECARVIYVDHADTATLKEKYRDHGFDVSKIVNVDAVWGERSLAECIGQAEVADYVLASHVIEHVPDLVTWLHELAAVLKPNGEIRLAIPDKRYTFDYIRRTTELPEVLDAFVRRTRTPLPLCILDHVLNVRKVDGSAAWAGPLDPSKLEPHHTLEQALELARDAIANGSYHDVHCWVFVPDSFAHLMGRLAAYGLHSLKCERIEPTAPNSIEFIVWLRRCEDRSRVVESWHRAETMLISENRTSGYLKTLANHPVTSVLRRTLRRLVTKPRS